MQVPEYTVVFSLPWSIWQGSSAKEVAGPQREREQERAWLPFP